MRRHVGVRACRRQAFNAGVSFLASAGILNWLGGGSLTTSGMPVGRNIGSAGEQQHPPP